MCDEYLSANGDRRYVMNHRYNQYGHGSSTAQRSTAHNSHYYEVSQSSNQQRQNTCNCSGNERKYYYPSRVSRASVAHGMMHPNEENYDRYYYSEHCQHYHQDGRNHSPSNGRYDYLTNNDGNGNHDYENYYKD